MQRLHHRHRAFNALRHSWYRVKLLARQNVKVDKNFFTSDAAFRLADGILPQGLKITTAGRSDGIGMQALSRMSAMCFAKAFGATYVHSPFTDVGHAPGPMQEWTAAWENLFNFGLGEEKIGSQHAVVNYPEYLTGKKTISPNTVLRFQQCWWFTRRYPAAFNDVQDGFRKKFGLKPARGRTFNIAIHVRRGDVQSNLHALRYTPNRNVLRTVQSLRQAEKLLGCAFSISIYSQGDEADFADFGDLGCRLQLDKDAVWTVRQLVEADMLVMAKSSFSYVAALINDGIVIYEPTFNPRLPGWITKRADGAVDPGAIAAAVQRYLGERREENRLCETV